jgi:hypothetical protein
VPNVACSRLASSITRSHVRFNIITAWPRQNASFLRNLLSVFRHRYECFGRQPKLSRLVLREMTFYDSGRQADRFRAKRERVVNRL